MSHPPRGSGRWTLALVLTLAASVTASLLGPPPAGAAPFHPGRAQHEKPVAGVRVPPRQLTRPRTGTPFTGAAPVWPGATTTDLDLAPALTAAAAPGFAPAAAPASRAGTAPVWVGPTAAGKAAPGKVRVQVYDHDTARRAGTDGLLLRVSGLTGGGAAKVAVDYSSFQWAYGADWSQRLRLSELPECALTTPELANCQPRPVASHNDAAARTVSATVTLAAPRQATSGNTVGTAADTAAPAGTLMALDAGPASSAGDYAATPLSSAATWTAGGSSGDFTWSYPMRSPPALGGPAPSVALSYTSSSVDGQMAATNNQPSWIGEGFEFDGGFIERKYRSCAEDMKNGANNTTKAGDLCWATDNATLSLSGHAGELLVDGSGGWHLRTDDGTRAEHRTGSANGARNGEYWVVTTTDGTQYWFGDKAATTLTVPVSGNHTGEPCHAAAFIDSFCTQAWRWNLDHVVDTRGNTMSYTWTKESGKYARNLKETDVVSYDRAAYLNRIDYGTRADRTETAPMQVVFDPADRCLADCGTHDAVHWPDVPWDQECTGSPCKHASPTFWTTKRLAKVTTRTGGRDVESWTLTHSFPNPGDGTRAGLWLDRISHRGLVGTAADLPDVVLTGVQLNNRVDTTTDGYAAMNWWRIKDIDTEYGGRTEITYSDRDCVAGSRMPDKDNLAGNTLRCYPTKWIPDGKTTPILDFFHKYVVVAVTESDLTNSGSTRKLTKYDYLGDPAWHYTDDDGLIGADYKTWSVWRGYGAVRETKGDPGEQTSAETRFFRGMGTTLPAAGAAPAVTDAEAYAGMTREKITYAGPGGAVVSAESNAPWQSDPRATRTVNGSTVESRRTGVAAAFTRTALDGGRADRTTSQTTVFDSYGEAVQTEDRGDDAVAGDETCELTDYVRNTTAWIVDKPSRTRTFAVDCARAQAGGLTDADVVGDERTSYDDKAFGTAPVKGLVTRSETLRAYHGGQPTYLAATSTYDAYGRILDAVDTRGNTTRTVYTPAAGGPLTQLDVTAPLGWKTTKTLDPAWGSTLVETDPNLRRTEWSYDGLGRTTAVWLPNRDRSAGQSASHTFTYLVRDNAPTVVTTRELTANGGYHAGSMLYDGLLRVRQSQDPDSAGGGNAVVVDNWYDSAGRASRATEPYLSDTPVGTALIRSTTVIPVATDSVYDGAARVTASIRLVNVPPNGSPGGTERWRTTTAYGGDRIDTTPPRGDTVTSKLTDTHGRTTELRQYHDGVAAGSTDPAGYDVTRYTYTAKDKLSRVTGPDGAHWDFGYDLFNNVVSTSDPDKGTATATFDDFGAELTTTDARGVTLAYTYDTIGRKTSVREGSATGPKRAEWVYDTLAYGQLTSATRYAGTDAYTQETLGLTADYQPTSVRYTVAGAAAGTYTYSYTYLADGSPYTVRTPALGDLKQETLKFGYDALGRPTTLRSGYGTAAETDLVTRTGYTSFGELGDYTLRNSNGNVVAVTRTYETDTRRLSQLWTSKQTSPTSVADLRYTWDDAGNITRLSEQVSGDTQCFRTDNLRRMTQAWTPASGDCATAPATAGLGGPAPYWQSFGYDKGGDRTSLVEHLAGGDRSTAYTVTAGTHRLDTATTGPTTSTWQYDAAGNTTSRPTGTTAQTLTWDREGHLDTVTDGTGTTSYVYDVDGARLTRTDPGGTTLYLPDQELRVTKAGAKTATRYYSHAGEQIGVRSGSGLTWLSGDHHGTAQLSITAVGQAVAVRRETPFGTLRATTGTWPAAMDKGFVGGTNDNTGLTHLGAREYDPGTGRFISVDPEFETADPQQLNAYTYSDNNPITLSDPAGTKWNWGKILKTAAVVVAVVAVIAVAIAVPAAIPAMAAAAGNAGLGALAGGATMGMAATAGVAAAAGEAAAAGAVVAGSGVIASTLYTAGKIASGYEQGDYPSGPVGTPRSPARRTPDASGGGAPDASGGVGPRPSGPVRPAFPGRAGRPDGASVISGHGDETGDRFRVPKGTYPVFGGPHRHAIWDSTGNLMERGFDVIYQAFRPGQFIQDYDVTWPDGLSLAGNPWIVDVPPDVPVRLSRLLRPNMGCVHLAFCRGPEWPVDFPSGPPSPPAPGAPPGNLGGWNRGHSRYTEGKE
ncbi:RHS repeat-associated core domain-containing protein [Catellatospora sp. TT07R-123]|uniref:RHS repeat-associated core domain-containing protein n=1 Tax=Catellatospora sp. TT07R-123 TaxID=2733863 RepID=UPI001BB2F033|nr:RHS repeat-associated core domain-containing protein [Catellatospora sp. TT07R-123]